MTAIAKLKPEQQAVVQEAVSRLLGRTDAFRKLKSPDREKVRQGLLNTVAYLADPAAGQPELARALEGEQQQQPTGVQQFKDITGSQKLVQKDFQAGALKAGTDAFKDMVATVDFPAFVSGLIEGVFTSIVNSSIRQMEAYQKLLEAVVKSVEEYASDHITDNQARDYLQGRFPDSLNIEVDNGTPKLALKDEAPEGAMDKIQAALGGQAQAVDLDDEESEQALVRRAQLEMARVRQQQLATMVLLGINRIVVTDGLINAKVVFEMKASDVAQRTNTASMYDSQSKVRSYGDSGGWFSGDYDNTTERHRTVVSGATDDTSEAKAQIKANLSGEVKVHFKSETFPLDKMASTGQLDAVGQRAQK
ncbi:MAG TPA: hypothetical protein VIQ25_02665 [Gemmatimonadales bacterium]|jgi:hypothetical protein